MLMKRNGSLAFMLGMLLSGATTAWADDQDRMRDRSQDQDRMEQRDQDMDRNRDQDQERIYGSQLMTPQERDEYRARLQAAKTAEERDRIRKEHHELMKKRAQERGVTLPDEPRDWNDRGPGHGMGQGMGPGGGGGNR